MQREDDTIFHTVSGIAFKLQIAELLEENYLLVLPSSPSSFLNQAPNGYKT